MPDTRVFVMLSGFPLWQNVAEEQLREIMGLMRYLELSIGESLELEGEAGEALLIVEEGLVKLVEEKKGWKTTLDIFGDATCLEELALFAPVFESHRLVALYPSRLLKLDQPSFAEYLQSHPEVGWQILVNVASLASQRSPVSELYRQPLEIRLARYLVGLARHRGIISPSGIAIDYPLQVADIQAAIGAREGEMVAALRSLVARNTLDLSQELVVTNLDQLKALAYGGAYSAS
ncbi:MAG: Crp/Fnr family transcriptional regulator [Firmicutes bacterium]|nr:Crp/Fnr family transcriptional regulator [Bacillota bacterium]